MAETVIDLWQSVKDLTDEMRRLHDAWLERRDGDTDPQPVDGVIAAAQHVAELALGEPGRQFRAVSGRGAEWCFDLAHAAKELQPWIVQIADPRFDGVSLSIPAEACDKLDLALAELETARYAGLSEPPAQTPIVDGELQMQRIAQAALDSDTVEILEIAKRPGLSADSKMAAIVRIDTRFRGKDSNDWATLLGITSAGVRSTPTWGLLQAGKKSCE